MNLDGQKELLGLWVAQTEGAKFWLQVVTELKNRGVQDLCPEGVHLHCLRGRPQGLS